MNNYIKDNYNIIETYEKNKYNEVQMGTKIDDSESIIVVNIINKIDSYSNNLKSNLENSLQNLLFIAENDDAITFVTDYHEGITLNDYLKSTTVSTTTRLLIAKKYLNLISKYDSLNNNFKKILVDIKQINIDKEDLYLNELILLTSNNEIEFSEVTKKIGEVLKVLLEKDEFIETLLNGSKFYHSISDINTIFDTHYNVDATNYFDDLGNDTIIPMPVDIINNDEVIIEDTNIKTDELENNDNEENFDKSQLDDGSEIELTSLGFIDDTEEEKENKPKNNKKNIDKNKLIISSIIILFLLFSSYLVTHNNFSFFNSNKNEEFIVSFNKERIDSNFKFTAIVDNNEEYKYEWKFFSNGEELASFDEKSITITFKNEGSYFITLRVQDEDGNWSNSYSEEIYHTINEMTPLDEEDAVKASTTENLDSYTISYETDNIIDDYEMKKSGSKSLKFDFNNDTKIGEILLKDILMKNDTSVSLFIKSNTREPITMKFIGINGNTEPFEKTINHIPSLENTWQMISFNINTSNIETLKIIFETKNSTIWVDDIEINAYK